MYGLLLPAVAMYRGNDQAVIGIALLCSTGLLIVGTICWLRIRCREQARRLDLIEAALRNPNLDRDVQRELVQALQPKPRRTGFVLGWFGAFAGIAWLCTEPRGDEWTFAVIVTVVAFALLTLPLALRELEIRKAR
jgi:hypothetical protein